MRDIESLIPHRRSMRLIEEMLEIGEDRCVTAAVADPRWPLAEEGGVNPIVLIELAAQSIGAFFGERELSGEGGPPRPGWLVGVKNAAFFVTRVPFGERITVTVRSIREEGTYVEVEGIAEINSAVAGEIHLQVYRPGE